MGEALGNDNLDNRDIWKNSIQMNLTVAVVRIVAGRFKLCKIKGAIIL
jgi:hypothetical protein